MRKEKDPLFVCGHVSTEELFEAEQDFFVGECLFQLKRWRSLPPLNEVLQPPNANVR